MPTKSIACSKLHYTGKPTTGGADLRSGWTKIQEKFDKKLPQPSGAIVECGKGL